MSTAMVSLMVSRNTTLVSSLGLRIGPACEAGLSAGMRRERVPPRIRKKEKERMAHFRVIRTIEPCQTISNCYAEVYLYVYTYIRPIR